MLNSKWGLAKEERQRKLKWTKYLRNFKRVNTIDPFFLKKKKHGSSIMWQTDFKHHRSTENNNKKPIREEIKTISTDKKKKHELTAGLLIFGVWTIRVAVASFRDAQARAIVASELI